MFLDPYFQDSPEGVRVSAAQASRFAKVAAGDFNPIHDEDSKRFCVPGDLLFAISLAQYGISQKMTFSFTGLVRDDGPLTFPKTDEGLVSITNAGGRECLRIEREGAICAKDDCIEALASQYVAFSGTNFPYVLVPMMEAQGVMINPAKPLVIYETMSFELDGLDFTKPELKPAQNEMTASGKRGQALLHFDIVDHGKKIGHGVKKLILSGLLPYDGEHLQGLVDWYLDRKANYRP